MNMEQSAQVQLDQGETGSVKTGGGIRQRCCLSPILINLYSKYLTKESTSPRPVTSRKETPCPYTHTHRTKQNSTTKVRFWGFTSMTETEFAVANTHFNINYITAHLDFHIMTSVVTSHSMLLAETHVTILQSPACFMSLCSCSYSVFNLSHTFYSFHFLTTCRKTKCSALKATLWLHIGPTLTHKCWRCVIACLPI